jgi:uncharacterized protein (TIGR02265 family)
MYFNAALRVVRQLLGPSGETACRTELGLGRYIDIFNYPVREFLQIIGYLGAAPTATMSVEQAYQRVGTEAAEAFLTSATGRTLLMVVGKNVRRSLVSVPAAYGAMVTFGTRRVEFEGASTARVHFAADLLAGCYHAEILEGGCSAILGSPVRVAYRQLTAFASECEVTWPG